ncbi:AvaI/BsoBI family type II restriction endonuclease [Thiofilum flexile]|uniref:AvaI/BsoBI family type II restriction endonuclease n=1 Tax=Thiofilum flexile TaxID=125627 RepID=UPI000364D11E|nr:AvaI/BsoBI family type II restriction endonuclease [Thiofilum flexile]
MANVYVQCPDDLITTSEARRNGFLEYALRRNLESEPFIDRAKALKVYLDNHSKQASDLVSLSEIRESLLEAAGLSVKAKTHLNIEDKDKLLANFIEKVLVPMGSAYKDEVVYRYLLTAGDALGGKMRNIVGLIAKEKLTRFVIAQLNILNADIVFYNKNWIEIDGKAIDYQSLGTIKAIKWRVLNNSSRILIYDINVPQVRKNIDIVLMEGLPKPNKMSVSVVKELLSDTSNYKVLGELKGGIDSAGADEHWKTALSALNRINTAFNKVPLIFIGAAIEPAMANEIFSLYTTDRLANCANLTNDHQLATLCDWLVKQ